MAKRRRQARQQFGLAPEEHLSQGDRWIAEATKIRNYADQRVSENPCEMIEHYTDAIAEGTVAEVQFSQAGRSPKAESRATIASRFVSETTRRQREAVQLCRRQK